MKFRSAGPGGPRRLAVLALLSACLLAAGAPAARGQDRPRENSPGNPDVPASVSGPRREFIRDPRLDADSTLFLHQWPVLEALADTLSHLRPALEGRSVPILEAARPVIRALADSLLADSLPTLLAPRRQEVRDRMIALGEALLGAQELAPAALAAPTDSSATETVLLEVFGPVDSGPGPPGLSPTNEEPPGAAAADSARRASASDSADHADWIGVRPDSLPVDPVEAYLDRWRAVYGEAEALLHRVRNPTAGEAE